MATAASNRPWYIVPGPEALCFYDGDGWACNSITNTDDGYLFTVLIPRQAADGAAPRDQDPITIEGVAPDDVTSVRATTLTGTESAAPVVGNIYVVRASTVKRLTFEGTATPSAITMHP